MKIPYLGRVTVNKIIGKAEGAQREKADAMVKALLRELPELLAVAVVDLKSGNLLSALTSTSRFNPHRLVPANVELMALLQKRTGTGWPARQQTEDLVVILDQELHCLRPVNGGKWFCYLAVSPAATTLAMARDVMRRYVA